MRQYGAVAPRQEMGRLHLDFESSVVRAARRAVASMRAISQRRRIQPVPYQNVRRARSMRHCRAAGLALAEGSEKRSLAAAAFCVPASSALDSGESRHLLDWALQLHSFSQLVKLVAAFGFRSKGCISAEALDGRSLVSRQKDRGVAAGIGSSRFRGLEEEKQRTPQPLPESHAAQAREIFIFCMEALRAIRGACNWGLWLDAEQKVPQGSRQGSEARLSRHLHLTTMEQTVHDQICFLFRTYILTAQSPRIATALQTIRS